VPIRKATADDVPQMRALEQPSETAAHWGGREYDALFAPGAPKRVALVAVDDAAGQICGFAVARCGPGEWEIENVVAAPERRGRGVGTGLVRELLQEARKWGCGAVLLEVRASNTPALRLYEKLGFTVSGRRNGYYRDPPEDALLLRLSLSGL